MACFAASILTCTDMGSFCCGIRAETLASAVVGTYTSAAAGEEVSTAIEAGAALRGTALCVQQHWQRNGRANI